MRNPRNFKTKNYKTGNRTGGNRTGNRDRIFKMPGARVQASTFGADVFMGFAQDQFEYHFDTKLQSGRPSIGSVVGDMLSKLFRQIVGWVPEDTHTKEQALDFLQTKGIPESQGRAMIDGDYQLFEPQTFVILQQELGLSPTDVVEIKKDIAQALGALNKADKQSLRTRE